MRGEEGRGEESGRGRRLLRRERKKMYEVRTIKPRVSQAHMHTFTHSHSHMHTFTNTHTLFPLAAALTEWMHRAGDSQ